MGLQKPIIIGLGVAVVSYGVYRGVLLKETAENVRVSLLQLPKIHKIDGTGLKVSLDMRLDNPVKSKVKIKIPSIKAYYNGKLLASTAINDKVYTIEPVSSGKITGTMIEATHLSLITTLPSIIMDFISQGNSLASRFGFDVSLEVDGVALKIQRI